ncbi:MAG: hypothetical protein WC998_06590 [Candidatus Paceibacterota bacterium]
MTERTLIGGISSIILIIIGTILIYYYKKGEMPSVHGIMGYAFTGFGIINIGMVIVDYYGLM